MPAKTRISFIDCSRGLLYLLMSSTHALTLANVASDSFLRSGWWLPRGWAFEGFITLSGFTAAAVYAWNGEKERTQRRLLQRAWQILAVMFVSNVFFLLGRYLLTQELERVKNPSWWIGLVTLKTEYSISGILLPTGILLLLTPLLFRADQRWRLPRLAVGLLVFALFVRTLQYVLAGRVSGHHLLSVLLYTGAGGFPVLPFVSSGALGFVLGLAWKRSPAQLGLRTGSAIVLFFLALQAVRGLPLPPAATGILYAFTVIARFLLILLVGAIVMEWTVLGRLLAFLPLVGKYALFSFVAHRMVMQALALLSRRLLPPTPAELLDSVYLVGTLGTITVLCALREHFALFDHSLKKLYL